MRSLQLTEGGGHYRLLVELGSGGMAEVFLAFVEGRGGLSKLQVVKQLKKSLADDQDFVRMFLDEARLGARLNHPNVVQTHEIGEQDGNYFLVMEYLEGQPLSRLRTQYQRKMGRPLPIEVNLRILTEVLRGLEYAHNLTDFDGTPLSVVHRDVSPQNVFITYDGVVKLVDFGVAKAAMNSVETRTGVMKGKLSYMAPEQVRGSQALDRRADIFSVGVMLHEAIVGERMWKGVPDVTIMSSLLEGRLPSLPPGAPTELKEARDRAMNIAPNQRYPTAGLFSLALEDALRGFPSVPQEELSALVRGLFHEERERAQATIDAQLKIARSLSKDSPKDENVRQSLQPKTHSIYPAVVGLPPPRISDLDATQPALPEPPGVPRFSSSPGDRKESSAGPAVLESPRRGQGVGPWLGGAALAFALVALVYFAGRDNGRQPATAEAAATSDLKIEPLLSASVGPITSSSSAPNESVGRQAPVEEVPKAKSAPTDSPTKAAAFTFEATPANARLLLDGKLLSGNPHEATYPLDEKVHMLRAEAPGYVTRAERLRFDHGAKVALALTAEPRHAAPLARTPAPTKSVEPPTEKEDTTIRLER